MAASSQDVQDVDGPGQYALLGTTEPEIIIAVIGVYRAGKTTFVSRLTGDTTLKISHPVHVTPAMTLFPNSTSTITSSTFNTRVRVLDTPGFCERVSEYRVLYLLYQYLARTYGRGFKLSDIILLQPFDDPDPGAHLKDKKRLGWYEKLLGKDPGRRIIIAWTKFDVERGSQLYTEAVNREDVWGQLVDNGAREVLHEDTKDSAEWIVWRIMDLGPPVESRSDEEIEAEEKRLADEVEAERIKRDEKFMAVLEANYVATKEGRKGQQKGQQEVAVLHKDMDDSDLERLGFF